MLFQRFVVSLRVFMLYRMRCRLTCSHLVGQSKYKYLHLYFSSRLLQHLMIVSCCVLFILNCCKTLFKIFPPIYELCAILSTAKLLHYCSRKFIGNSNILKNALNFTKLRCTMRQCIYYFISVKKRDFNSSTAYFIIYDSYFLFTIDVNDIDLMLIITPKWIFIVMGNVTFYTKSNIRPSFISTYFTNLWKLQRMLLFFDVLEIYI